MIEVSGEVAEVEEEETVKMIVKAIEAVKKVNTEIRGDLMIKKVDLIITRNIRIKKNKQEI